MRNITTLIISYLKYLKNLTAAEPGIKFRGALKAVDMFCISLKYKIIITLSNAKFVKNIKFSIMIMLRSGYITGYKVRTRV